MVQYYDGASPVLGYVLHHLSTTPSMSQENVRHLEGVLSNPGFIQTDGDNLEHYRSYQILDWLIRENVPRWLALAGFDKEARALVDLDPLESLESAHAAVSSLHVASEKALMEWRLLQSQTWRKTQSPEWNIHLGIPMVAAWDATWDAARYGPRDSGWNIAQYAARMGAPTAAWTVLETAGAVAWDATWASARAVAWKAVEELIADLGDPGTEAVSLDRRPVFEAALRVATGALEPTVDHLQHSLLIRVEGTFNPEGAISVS